MKKFFIIAVLVITAGLFWWYQGERQYQNDVMRTPETSTETQLVSFEIPSGAALRTISSSLYNKGLIVSTSSFERYIAEQGLEQSLPAGSFTMHRSLSIPEVTDILLGKLVLGQQRITVREGLSVTEIASYLEQQGLTTKEAFLACITDTCDFQSDYSFLPSKNNPDYAYDYSYIEGYLFPDTYFIQTVSYTDDVMVRRMLDAFESKIATGLADEIKASDYTLEQAVIMGSILEKESRPRDDQSMVSGVLWKRYENGVQLGADATTRYLKENPLDALTYVELQSKNPYNTRRSVGLPPSAISNAGLASIKAAISPTASEYWYYLHDNTGQIHYSVTETEHNRKKAIYLN